MIIYYHVVVVLVWHNTLVKQFIRALNDVYALTFGLIVAPTRFSTKGGGREMICIGYACRRFSRRWSIRCTAPPTLYASKRTMDYR